MASENRYIDPTTDYGFKRIFGNGANSKSLLISLLNGLFRGRRAVTDLTYDRNDHVGDTEGEGGVIFDLTCTDQNGDRFVVEIQRTGQENLKRRMLVYGSRMVVDQVPDGGRAAWNYGIKGVCVIVLMDGFRMPGGGNGRAVHDVCLCDRETKEVFQEDIGFIYVELENFKKTEEEVSASSDLDKWLYILKNMSGMDALPKYTRKTIFEKVFRIAEYAKLNTEEREMYNASVKQKWDEHAKRETALKEGMRMGMERGIERERARSEERMRSIALAMKRSGMPAGQVAGLLGMDEEEVEKLQGRADQA